MEPRPAGTATAVPRPARTLDPVRERRRVERAREDELRDARAMATKLNKSLGVLFVRGVQIDHATLRMTIDGSIWENESEGDKAALTAQMRSDWTHVYETYNKSAAAVHVHLLDLDGTDLAAGVPGSPR